MEDLLPANVMFDIVSRLPVKTIIQCKCTCKKWRDLISDPYFVRLHLSRSREALMIFSKYEPPRPGILKWVEIGHKAIIHVKSFNLEGCAPVAGYWTNQVGSANGLICYAYHVALVLIYNPVVEEFMILPQPPQKDLRTLGYGFGVSRTGEYKVIRLSCKRISSEADEVEAAKIEVYTLGTGQWRILEQTPYYLNSMHDELDDGVFVNGHVYWLGGGQIYDFDSSTETFELFPSPPVDNRESEKKLGVLGGRLSQVSWCSLGLEVWVMKEESWYKEGIIGKNVSHLLAPKSGPICLLDGLKDTSILLFRKASFDCSKLTQELMAHCLTTDTIQPLKMKLCLDPIMTYRPSFVKLSDFGLERVIPMYDRETICQKGKEKSRRGEENITKYYVTNFPEVCNRKDLEETFEEYGAVVDVYIARKRNKDGKPFGFVSFRNVKNGKEMEKRLQKVSMGRYKLKVNIAKFAAENK